MSTISATVSTFRQHDIPVFIGIRMGRAVNRLQRERVLDNPCNHDTGHPVPLLLVFKNSAEFVDVVPGEVAIFLRKRRRPVLVVLAFAIFWAIMFIFVLCAESADPPIFKELKNAILIVSFIDCVFFS